ncbi:NTP transferase domain-containing protein [Candidatus Woesearchaeota archaeon]|nr:NTP transferase domain-containing protein [Candidatus Woesearchaeota archaeon]
MQKVRKAIIAAAGLNSRMYPYTKVESKLFLQILNKPVVEYIIEELASSGIEEVIIVSNHISKIKRFFSKDKELNALLKKLKKESAINKFRRIESLCKVNTIGQYEPMGWMHEVWHARDYVKDEPFIVTFSDVLYRSKVPAAKQIIEKFEKNNKNIRAQGRFLFKPEIFKTLQNERYNLGEDNVDVNIFEKLSENNDVFNMNIKGKFYNVGDPLSYMKTETEFALEDKNIGKEYRKFLKSIVK